MALDASRTQQIDHLGDLWTIGAAARELRTTFWVIDRLIRTQNIATYSIGQARLVRLSDVRLHLQLR